MSDQSAENHDKRLENADTSGQETDQGVLSNDTAGAPAVDAAIPPWEEQPKEEQPKEEQPKEETQSQPAVQPEKAFSDPFLQKHDGAKKTPRPIIEADTIPTSIPATVPLGATAVELPLSKNHQGENFYIASFFMPKDKAVLVHQAYDFARVCDDIADSPVLATLDKRGRLEGFKRALMGEEEDPDYQRGFALRQTLLEHSISLDYMLGLMDAFLMDVDKSRYQTWAELQHYCHLSAAMVGRMMLDVFGEHKSLYPLSDAICYALQMLNHLTDMKKDLHDLDRCYLPADLMHAHHVSMDDISAQDLSPNLRACLDEALGRVQDYLTVGSGLAQEVEDPRLAIEVSALITVLTKWHGLLIKNDPLAQEIALSKGEKMWHFMKGAWHGLMA